MVINNIIYIYIYILYIYIYIYIYIYTIEIIINFAKFANIFIIDTYTNLL